MHAVLLPFGSAGDVFPFLWLGRQLKAAGHEVTVITSAAFEKHVIAAGMRAVPLGTQEEFERLIHDPRVWRLYEGTKMVFELAGQATGPVLEAIEDLLPTSPRPSLLMAPCTAFGARLAREKHGIPLVTVDVQPAVMISAHEPPVLLPGMQHFKKLPLWLRRFIIRLPNPGDRFSGPAVRAACAVQGVPAPRSVWWDWGHSPDGTLALFPEWLAKPQPDWPGNLLQWDFPLEDMARESPLTQEVQAFLAEGEKPIVFTPGSANVQAQRFFAVALAAVTALGKRAVFVTRQPGQLPHPLPASVLAVEYAPFSALVPQAAAFVHHGGIGTLSQGFAAGVPQLIMAMAHDQPDNAWRLEQLGAGLGLSTRTFTPKRVQNALHRLLTEPSYQEAAQRCQEKIHQRPSVTNLLRWLEERAR